MANIPRTARRVINDAQKEDTLARDVGVSVISSIAAAYILASVLGGGR